MAPLAAAGAVDVDAVGLEHTCEVAERDGLARLPEGTVVAQLAVVAAVVGPHGSHLVEGIAPLLTGCGGAASGKQFPRQAGGRDVDSPGCHIAGDAVQVNGVAAFTGGGSHRRWCFYQMMSHRRLHHAWRCQGQVAVQEPVSWRCRESGYRHSRCNTACR